MVAGNTEEAQLGSARGRFLDGLPRKASELRSAVALLRATPAAEGPREDMRRRLHALFASAETFHDHALADALSEAIARLDAARAAQRAVDEADLTLLAGLVKRLPELRGAPRSDARGADDHDDASRTSAIELAAYGNAPTQPLLQRVLHLLLLSTRGEQAELVELLRSDSLRVTALASVDELLASARDDAPDLVVASEQLAHAGDLLARLRADAATDFVPVVLFEGAPAGSHAASADGAAIPLVSERADARVARPFSSEQLVRAIGRATGTLVASQRLEPLGELTLDELAARVARELQRGLVDAAVSGRSARIRLDDDGQVLAATYGALAELRAAVVRASDGEVRFSSASERAPALVSLTPVTATEDTSLLGRRIVLAEDDAAIALLFANTLRAHGATVHELTDGREALASARRERPDLVLAGARLPSLDAFALSRELARDPLLADVPVLLLPDKARLLMRGREPNAVSQLQPELAAQVLASALALLEPRRLLEERLKEPGEVRGTLEGIGVIALLRSVRRTRPDARVRIRDAWNLFECELRGGRLAQVTRTACDGSFVRNEPALPPLLGIRAGRFTVCSADSPMKGCLEGTLDEVLTRGALALAGELDAVSGSALERVARVVFDEDAYALLVQQTPRAVRTLLERLYQGEAPRALLARHGAASPLEPLLLDLARRGALKDVLGSAGEDLIREAREARAEATPTELASPLSVLPPPPNPVISMLASASELPTLEPVSAASAAPPAQVARPEPPRAPPAQPAVARASTPPRARGNESSPSDASELAAAAAEARRSRSTLAAWTVALLALAATAFFVAREPMGQLPAEALGADPTPEPAPVAAPEVVAATATYEDGFAVYDGILDSTLGVPADHGLLVVHATPDLASATVWLNERELGPPPQKVALPAGVHELAIKRGDAVSYRFVSVHPGRTWVLSKP